MGGGKKEKDLVEKRIGLGTGERKGKKGSNQKDLGINLR